MSAALIGSRVGRFALVGAAATLGLVGMANGQATNVTPATSASPTSGPALLPVGSASHPVALQATITGVQGLVQVRQADDQPWMRAQVGMVLDEGATFRTGLRSSVRFVIPPDQTVTLDRLGQVKLLQAVASQGKVTTDLGMSYGRTRYEIEAAGIAHVSTIHSPNSTLAVRGTTVTSEDQRPFPPEAVSLTGTAQYATAKREMQVGGKGTGTATAVGSMTPAETALMASVLDPNSAAARTENETQLVTTVLSQGNNAHYDPGSGVPIVTGVTPPSDATLISEIKDPFFIVLRWTGNTNLDLFVFDPLSADQGTTKYDTIAPRAGLNIASNGAIIPFDDQGGATGGYEVAKFPTYFKENYGANIQYVSGAPTSFTVEAFLNGQAVNLTASNFFGTTTQFTGSVGPTQRTDATTAELGGNIFGFDVHPTRPAIAEGPEPMGSSSGPETTLRGRLGGR